jgi:hypothetical protein
LQAFHKDKFTELHLFHKFLVSLRGGQQVFHETEKTVFAGPLLEIQFLCFSISNPLQELRDIDFVSELGELLIKIGGIFKGKLAFLFL